MKKNGKDLGTGAGTVTEEIRNRPKKWLDGPGGV